MRFNTLAGTFSIAIGILVFIVWGFLLANNQVTQIAGMLFHLAAEFSMASLMIASGILLLKNSKWAFSLFFTGSGMLFYSVLNAASYYAIMEQSGPVFFFLLLFCLTVPLLILGIKKHTADK